jgi:uracil-DNA glycosylase family 4
VTLEELHGHIVECRRCPRLVEWRERVAVEKRAAYADWTYWGRPIPGFGDPQARLAIVGLAPAAHGANRTGRIFTGDRSGDFLYAALHRAGYANQPVATHREDGLRLTDCFITSPVRCAPPANKPLPAERDACAPWLHAELALLPNVRVLLCLGAFAWDAALRATAALGDPPSRPRPRFAHGAVLRGARLTLVGCFHVSQQNTFTGRLTPAMLDRILANIRHLADPIDDTESVPSGVDG